MHICTRVRTTEKEMCKNKHSFDLKRRQKGSWSAELMRAPPRTRYHPCVMRMRKRTWSSRARAHTHWTRQETFFSSCSYCFCSQNSFHTFRYPADTKLLSSLNLFVRVLFHGVRQYLVCIPLSYLSFRFSVVRMSLRSYRRICFFLFASDFRSFSHRAARHNHKHNFNVSLFFLFVRQIAHYKTISRC